MFQFPITEVHGNANFGYFKTLRRLTANFVGTFAVAGTYAGQRLDRCSRQHCHRHTLGCGAAEYRYFAVIGLQFFRRRRNVRVRQFSRRQYLQHFGVIPRGRQGVTGTFRGHTGGGDMVACGTLLWSADQ